MPEFPADRALVEAEGQVRRLGVIRMATSGGITSAVIFALCWVGTFIPFSSPTHALIGLFTAAPMSSVNALLEGGLWSLLFGGFSAAVFAITYNGLGGLERR